MINNVKNVSGILPQMMNKKVCCTNKKCATRTEVYVEQRLRLVDKDNMEYKCEYCDFIQKIIK